MSAVLSVLFLKYSCNVTSSLLLQAYDWFLSAMKYLSPGLLFTVCLLAKNKRKPGYIEHIFSFKRYKDPSRVNYIDTTFELFPKFQLSLQTWLIYLIILLITVKLKNEWVLNDHPS